MPEPVLPEAGWNRIHMLSAIFPLTVLVPWILLSAFAWLLILGTPGLRQFIVAIVIVSLTAYLIMPRYVRLISRWLYR